MKRLRLLLSIALLGTLVASAMPQPANAAHAYPGTRMIEAINYVRAQSGLRQLRTSQRLIRSCAARGKLMMQADFFAHPTQLRVPTFDRVGEILELHRNHRRHISRTIRLWGNSPGHRAVMLASHYGWIGAARAVGRYGGDRATIWVVRFGRH